MKGAYILIIFLNKNNRIRINKKIISFIKGYYCYVGSAMNNLEKRIERHKSKKKRKHWHIDYFLDYGEIVDVVKIVSNNKIECNVSKKLGKKADSFIKGFGCSDCKCSSHLYYFSKNPAKILKIYGKI